MYMSCLRQFHLKCNIYSITSKLTIDLILNYVKMFEFQNGSTRKLACEQQTHFWSSLLSYFSEGENQRPEMRLLFAGY